MKILIIDGSYLTYKSLGVYGTKQLMIERDGEDIITSPIFGFVREIIMARSSYTYDFFICVWDRGPYIKKLKYSSYKDRKSTMQDVTNEKEILKAILFDLHIPVIYSKGYEGEDIAKTLLIRLKDPENIVDLFSNDGDCYALLSKNTSMMSGKEKFFTIQDLKEKHKVTPKQFVVMKAIMGCRSDTVKGVTGIGPVYASELAREYDSVDEIINKIDNITRRNARIGRMIKRSIEDGELYKSRYLTKILKPKKLFREIPRTKGLSYIDILNYLDARTLTTGNNKLTLEIIKKSQKKYFNKIKELARWK